MFPAILALHLFHPPEFIVLKIENKLVERWPIQTHAIYRALAVRRDTYHGASSVMASLIFTLCRHDYIIITLKFAHLICSFLPSTTMVEMHCFTFRTIPTVTPSTDNFQCAANRT